MFLPPKATPQEIENYLRGSIQLEQVSERSRILAQALQGMCLTELRKQHGHHNVNRHSAQCGVGWEEYIDKSFGISDDTAQRRIKCWIAVQARIAKLSEGEKKSAFGLLSKSPSQLTEQEFVTLKAVTHKVTDRVTQAQLIEEADYLILPPGERAKRRSAKHAGDKGGAHVSDPKEEQVQLHFHFDNFLEIARKAMSKGKDKVTVLAHLPRERWLAIKADLEALIKEGDAVHGLGKSK
jgi:hypothetical protein